MSTRLFSIKLPFLHTKVEMHLHHRWEKDLWSHHWKSGIGLDTGVNYYRGLNVRGKPGQYAKTFIPYLYINPIFGVVVTITYRYKSELVLTIPD